MFLDAREIENKRDSYNICIVGAGAAGITLAKALKDSPLSLCLLESGGLDSDPETQSLYQGDIIGFPYYPLDTPRSRYFGGTTAVWGGCCWPLEANEFEKRDWVPYSGWPFSRQELDPYYIKAHEICEIGPFNYDAQYWSDKADRPMLPLEAGRVVTKIYQNSPPTRFGTHYREDIEKAQNITTILYANVTDIALDPLNQAVEKITVKTLSGNAFDVKADIFILAAGGLENPRLLLLNDIGNQNDLVGRFFMEHIMLPASRLVLPRKIDIEFYIRAPVENTEIRAGLALRTDVLEQERILNSWSGFTLKRTPSIQLQYRWRVLKSELSKGEIPDNLRYHVKMVLSELREIYADKWNSGDSEDAWVTIPLLSHAEQSPNPMSRVMLGNELDALGQRRIKLDWRITDLERRSMRRAQEIIAAEIGRSNLGRAQILAPEEPDVWADPTRLPEGAPPIGSYHHMGTTRMHMDPKLGVVDTNCRVHGTKNLYIAGSSVFPTCGFENPTLTIIAMAYRMADHIRSLG